VFVEMLITVGTAAGPYRRGQVYDVDAATGAEWVRVGQAAQTDTPPPHVAELLARLDDGADGPVVFLPFVGEFGHLIMSHVRLVHFHRSPDKLVCCRPGEEVLYPSASGFVTTWRDPVSDYGRVGTMRDRRFPWPMIRRRHRTRHPIDAGALTPEQEVYPLRPDRPIPFRPTPRGLRADVVLGVRRRSFCPERNWPHWQRVADAARAAGLTFAVVGDRATSFDLEGQACHSGDHDTAAAVELMQGCRLFVGTDSGASHLAATVGCPMLVFRETAGGSRDLTGRMAAVNPGRVDVLPGGWDRPDTVAARVVALAGRAAA
jgi:hypothetical protein